MGDMTQVIAPKSDQINADDLIGGPRTITIREVRINGGNEQPVSVFFDGSDKAFRPCKSMSRVLVAAWGADAKEYVGRSLTLYRDPSVKWGGLEVGGIRISHMSHIESKLVLALTATRGSRKPYTIMPLTISAATDKAKDWANSFVAEITAADDVDAVVQKSKAALAKLEGERPELFAACQAAIEARKPAQPESGDPFADPFDGPANDQRVETVTLDHALTMLDSAETVIDVNARYDSLKNDFDGEEADQLGKRRDERIETLKGGK